MCKHKWLRHEDVSECIKCGLTVTYDGKALHDRRFPGIVGQRKRRPQKVAKKGRGKQGGK